MTVARRSIALTVALALAACGQNAKSPDPAPTGSALPLVSNASPATAPVAAAIAPDFGDDASRFSRDGECDDKRFSGPGLTTTTLLDSDVGHDATDCRAAYDQHRLVYGAAPTSGRAAPSPTYAASGVDHIQWGDDGGDYARDGECDDKRFAGAGMTSTPLLEADIQHDATDCRAAYEQGRLQLRS